VGRQWQSRHKAADEMRGAFDAKDLQQSSLHRPEVESKWSAGVSRNLPKLMDSATLSRLLALAPKKKHFN
jgi:hypothetical protein